MVLGLCGLMPTLITRVFFFFFFFTGVGAGGGDRRREECVFMGKEGARFEVAH